MQEKRCMVQEINNVTSTTNLVLRNNNNNIISGNNITTENNNYHSRTIITNGSIIKDRHSLVASKGILVTINGQRVVQSEQERNSLQQKKSSSQQQQQKQKTEDERKEKFVSKTCIVCPEVETSAQRKVEAMPILETENVNIHINGGDDDNLCKYPNKGEESAPRCVNKAVITIGSATLPSRKSRSKNSDKLSKKEKTSLSRERLCSIGEKLSASRERLLFFGEKFTASREKLASRPTSNKRKSVHSADSSNLTTSVLALNERNATLHQQKTDNFHGSCPGLHSASSSSSSSSSSSKSIKTSEPTTTTGDSLRRSSVASSSLTTQSSRSVTISLSSKVSQSSCQSLAGHLRYPDVSAVTDRLSRIFCRGRTHTYHVQRRQKGLSLPPNFADVKTTGNWVTVANLRQLDGGILDPDDRLCDVVDDRDQIIAVYTEHPAPCRRPAGMYGSTDTASSSSVTVSRSHTPDVFQDAEPTYLERADIEVTGEALNSTPPPLQVRRGSEPNLNRLSPIPSDHASGRGGEGVTGTPLTIKPLYGWSAPPSTNGQTVAHPSSTPMKGEEVIGSGGRVFVYPSEERGEGSGEEKNPSSSSTSSSASSHHSATNSAFSRFARDTNRCSIQILSDNPSMSRWADAAERIGGSGMSYTEMMQRRDPVGGASCSPHHSRQPSLNARSDTSLKLVASNDYQNLPPLTQHVRTRSTDDSLCERQRDHRLQQHERSRSHDEKRRLASPPPEERVLVVLNNGCGPLGIHVIPSPASGQDGSGGGLVVEGVEEGCRVAQDGRIEVDDRIIDINGHSLLNTTFHQAQEIFKDAMQTPALRLLVAKARHNTTRANTSCNLSSPSTVEAPQSTSLATLSIQRTPAAVPSLSSRTQTVMLQSSSRRPGRLITICLTKGPHGLGFSITTRDNPARGHAPIYIKSILPQGAAIEEGSLRIGDKLVSVNGKEVTGLSQTEVANMLRKVPVGGRAVLEVSRQERGVEASSLRNSASKARRGKLGDTVSSDGVRDQLKDDYPPSPQLPRQLGIEKTCEDSLIFPWRQREIITLNIPVHDSERAGLGVSVKGKTSSGNAACSSNGTEAGLESAHCGPVDLGIFVKNVICGGAASRDGRLRENDQLININGLSLLGKSNSEAMSTLRVAMHQEGPMPGMITLTIARRVGTPSSIDASGPPSIQSTNSLPRSGRNSANSGVSEILTASGVHRTAPTTPTPYEGVSTDAFTAPGYFNCSTPSSDPLTSLHHNPVIHRLTGNSAALRNDSYYQATHDTWNNSEMAALSQVPPEGGSQGPAVTGCDKISSGTLLGSPTVNPPARNTMIIQDEYTSPGGGDCLDDTYNSQSSLDTPGLFSRDQFGRQSMSEKRHATLDAKNTDTYQRSKKAREERERLKQQEEQHVKTEPEITSPRRFTPHRSLPGYVRRTAPFTSSLHGKGGLARYAAKKANSASHEDSLPKTPRAQDSSIALVHERSSTRSYRRNKLESDSKEMIETSPSISIVAGNSLLKEENNSDRVCDSRPHYIKKSKPVEMFAISRPKDECRNAVKTRSKSGRGEKSSEQTRCGLFSVLRGVSRSLERPKSCHGPGVPHTTHDVGPALGMKKSSSLESLQTMVHEVVTHAESGVSVRGSTSCRGRRGSSRVPRGRGCNESFRAAVDRSYDAHLSHSDANIMDTLAEEDAENSNRVLVTHAGPEKVLQGTDGKRNKGLLKGLGSMFRFGKHRKTLDNNFLAEHIPLPQHPARLTSDVQSRVLHENITAPEKISSPCFGTDSGAGSDATSPCDISQSSGDGSCSRTERMHQLRAQHQLRHQQRNRMYPTDGAEEQYDQQFGQVSDDQKCRNENTAQVSQAPSETRLPSPATQATCNSPPPQLTLDNLPISPITPGDGILLSPLKLDTYTSKHDQKGPEAYESVDRPLRKCVSLSSRQYEKAYNDNVSQTKSQRVLRSIVSQVDCGEKGIFTPSCYGLYKYPPLMELDRCLNETYDTFDPRRVCNQHFGPGGHYSVHSCSQNSDRKACSPSVMFCSGCFRDDCDSSLRLITTARSNKDIKNCNQRSVIFDDSFEMSNINDSTTFQPLRPVVKPLSTSYIYNDAIYSRPVKKPVPKICESVEFRFENCCASCQKLTHQRCVCDCHLVKTSSKMPRSSTTTKLGVGLNGEPMSVSLETNVPQVMKDNSQPKTSSSSLLADTSINGKPPLPPRNKGTQIGQAANVYKRPPPPVHLRSSKMSDSSLPQPLPVQSNAQVRSGVTSSTDNPYKTPPLPIHLRKSQYIEDHEERTVLLPSFDCCATDNVPKYQVNKSLNMNTGLALNSLDEACTSEKRRRSMSFTDGMNLNLQKKQCDKFSPKSQILKGNNKNSVSADKENVPEGIAQLHKRYMSDNVHTSTVPYFGLYHNNFSCAFTKSMSNFNETSVQQFALENHNSKLDRSSKSDHNQALSEINNYLNVHQASANFTKSSLFEDHYENITNAQHSPVNRGGSELFQNTFKPTDENSEKRRLFDNRNDASALRNQCINLYLRTNSFTPGVHGVSKYQPNGHSAVQPLSSGSSNSSTGSSGRSSSLPRMGVAVAAKLACRHTSTSKDQSTCYPVQHPNDQNAESHPCSNPTEQSDFRQPVDPLQIKTPDHNRPVSQRYQHISVSADVSQVKTAGAPPPPKPAPFIPPKRLEPVPAVGTSSEGSAQSRGNTGTSSKQFSHYANYQQIQQHLRNNEQERLQQIACQQYRDFREKQHLNRRPEQAGKRSRPHTMFVEGSGSDTSQLLHKLEQSFIEEAIMNSRDCREYQSQRGTRESHSSRPVSNYFEYESVQAMMSHAGGGGGGDGLHSLRVPPPEHQRPRVHYQPQNTSASSSNSSGRASHKMNTSASSGCSATNAVSMGDNNNTVHNRSNQPLSIVVSNAKNNHRAHDGLSVVHTNNNRNNTAISSAYHHNSLPRRAYHHNYQPPQQQYHDSSFPVNLTKAPSNHRPAAPPQYTRSSAAPLSSRNPLYAQQVTSFPSPGFGSPGLLPTQYSGAAYVHSHPQQGAAVAARHRPPQPVPGSKV